MEPGAKASEVILDAWAKNSHVLGKKFGFTDRQVQVLGHLASGKSNVDIGKALDLTEKAVKFHLTNIYKAVPGVRGRTQLANIVWETCYLACAGK